MCFNNIFKELFEMRLPQQDNTFKGKPSCPPRQHLPNWLRFRQSCLLFHFVWGRMCFNKSVTAKKGLFERQAHIKIELINFKTLKVRSIYKKEIWNLSRDKWCKLTATFERSLDSCSSDGFKSSGSPLLCSVAWLWLWSINMWNTKLGWQPKKN